MIECPHCHRVSMMPQKFYSGSSGLLRQDGAQRVNLISGYTCWNCGEWRELDLDPVFQFDMKVKSLAPVTPRYETRMRTAAYYFVNKYFEVIVNHRAAGASWDTISRFFKEAGHRCTTPSLMKYFELEQEKRCCDGQAA